MEADVSGASHEHASPNGEITRRDVLDAVTDWKKLITVMFNVLATLPVSAFGYFMPLIVKGMGYSGVNASLMSVSPFVVGACGLFVFVYLSDRFKERSIVVSCSMVLAIIGLVVMYTSDRPKLRYGFVHVCLAGAFTAGPLIVAWLAGNSPEKVCRHSCLELPGTNKLNQAKRSIIIGINGYSNLAGVIAGQLFKSRYGPHCTEIFCQPGSSCANCIRPFPTSNDDDLDCDRSIWIYGDALRIGMGESTTVADHADVDSGRL